MATFIVRWKEGRTIHAGSPDGNDVTLCGYALEGEASSWDMENVECVQIDRGRINCPTCLAIIRYCKLIPAARLRGGAQGRTYMRRAALSRAGGEGKQP